MPEIQRAKARKSKIHGTGLFATEDVPKGEKIIEYTGEKISKTEAVRRYEEQAEKGAIYLFDLNKRYDIDGASQGNDAKFANHSCSPNAETIIEGGHIWIHAKRDIAKGEEILYDYNFPLFDHEKRPCRCGADNCRGWIISKSAYYYKRRKERQAAEKKGIAERRASRTTPAKRSAKKQGKKAAKKKGKKAGKKQTTRRAR